MQFCAFLGSLMRITKGHTHLSKLGSVYSKIFSLVFMGLVNDYFIVWSRVQRPNVGGLG